MFDYLRIRFDEKDEAIRVARLAKWQARSGPRVGDFVRMPDGELRRWAYHWGDSIQPTWGPDASFYFTGGGGMSMSGGLDSSIALDRIRDTGETVDGGCWFFHHDSSGAHRGVTCTVPCRVYAVEG